MSAGMKSVPGLLRRAQGKYQRLTAQHLSRRPFTINSDVPIVSFTFDDFPRSALLTGGAILRSLGVHGTYYVSLGLMGKQIETGAMFVEEDLRNVFEQGHEIGCHTFSHSPAWETSPAEFEREIVANQHALKRVLPTASFSSMSYPISNPRAQTKRRSGKYFACCRGGGQTFNAGRTDLNYLSAYFIEQARETPQAIKDVIDATCRANGWLILATHDIAEQPTRWGCTPQLFDDIARYATKSGARVMPVMTAFEYLSINSSAIRTGSRPARQH
jgi:peptidoglycan/xylan/chitin deacetylase (PgdA/CDA1 family)